MRKSVNALCATIGEREKAVWSLEHCIPGMRRWSGMEECNHMLPKGVWAAKKNPQTVLK